MKLTFRTQIAYTHRIDDNDKLVDQSCAVDHPHDNVVIEVAIPVTEEFLDFKTIKEKTLSILNNYNGVNITNIHGITDTECLITQIKKRLDLTFHRNCDVGIWETEKYGIEIVSN